MPSCIVRGCLNYDKKCTKLKNNITFHRFPADPIRNETWCQIISHQRADPYFKSNKYLRVCSDHFQDEDFKITQGGLRTLKVSAIPRNKIQTPDATKKPSRYRTRRQILEKNADELNIDISSFVTIEIKLERDETESNANDLSDTVRKGIKLEEDDASNEYGLTNNVKREIKVENDKDVSIDNDSNNTVGNEIKLEKDDINTELNEDNITMMNIVSKEKQIRENNAELIEHNFTTVCKGEISSDKVDNESNEDELEDFELSDLQSDLDSPREVVFKRKISKLILSDKKKTKKIKSLQIKNVRLKNKIKSLMDEVQMLKNESSA